MTGYVYAIECAGRIKLGFSEDPERRFNKVASDAPFPCELLAFWPGSKADEMDVQDKFRAVRVHGEWFAATTELLDFVRSVGAKVQKRQKGTTICGIELARGAKGDLANLLGIDASVLGRWRRVPAHHVRAVSDYTGIEPSKLRPDLYAGMVEAAS